MRTTVDIPDELYRQAKAYAALNGVKLRELIERGLELAMEREPGDASARRIKLPLIPVDGREAVSSEAAGAAIKAAEAQSEYGYRIESPLFKSSKPGSLSLEKIRKAEEDMMNEEDRAHAGLD